MKRTYPLNVTQNCIEILHDPRLWRRYVTLVRRSNVVRSGEGAHRKSPWSRAPRTCRRHVSSCNCPLSVSERTRTHT